MGILIMLSVSRALFSSNNKTKWVMSPIFYGNAVPHIGHLYTAVLCDALVRTEKVLNKDEQIKFSIGTDEHGLKIQKRAMLENTTPQALVDSNSQTFKHLFDKAH